MSDLDHPPQRWLDWVGEACAAVGVDADAVDIVQIHDLSKQVAHRLERPLAPVSTFILGLALGAAGAGAGAGPGKEVLADEELLQRILATLPAETQNSPHQP